MGSFTDLIPKFNPYIQQLPVEAMVAVGMDKQRRYEEGVQRIQAQIDQVAGLSLIKPEHKQYLQSKLNELGNNLKGVAAGDFSNFQLVNSVGGMVGQISRDPIVTNAVISTKKYMKEKENMEALIKEGKGSASRTWEFNKKANDWLNDKDLSSTFDGTYKPYTNWRKNATEILKALTGDSTIKDDAFDIDQSGNLVLSDAMTRTKFAGISPEKIQQGLLAGLSPDDWDQISVDGRYTYSNVTPEQFAQSVTNSYRSKMEGFINQRTFLENAKSSTKSAPEIDKINTRIEEIDKMLNRMEGEYDGIMGTIVEGNVESAKARLYTNNVINDFAKAFSYTETSQTYETNPFLQPAQWRENKEMEWKKFTMEYRQKEKFHKDAMAKEDEKIRLQREGQEGYGGFPNAVDPKDLPDVTIGKVINQTVAAKEQADKADADFLKFQGKDKVWLEQQRAAWKKSPNGVSPLVAQHFNQTESNRQLAEENEVMIANINQEADRKFENVYSGIPKDAKDVLYTSPTGQVYRFTPKDFVDFNTKRDRFMKITSLGRGGERPDVTYDDAKAKEELTPKEYLLYTIEKKQSTGRDIPTAKETALYDYVNYYRGTVNIPYSEIIKEKEKFVSNEIKRRVIGFQGVGYVIPTKTPEQKQSLASVFSSVVELAKSQKGAIALSPNLDVGVLEKIAQSGDVEGTINVVEGTEFSPAMYEVVARGKVGTTRFRITPEQKQAIFGNRFEPSPAIQALRPYLATMMKFRKLDNETGEPVPYMSTSFDGRSTNATNARLGPTDFFNVNAYGVSGNIVSGDGGKTFSLEMNIFDPITKKLHENIPYPRILPAEEVVKIMMGLTDASVYQLINKKSATNADLKTLQEASQKPF